VSTVADLRTYLLTQSGVTDLVSTRIYYENLPQDATLPAVVLNQTAEDLVRHLAASDTLSRVSLLVDIYSTTEASANAVSAAVTAAVEMDTGTWGSSTIRRAYIESVSDAYNMPRDGSEQLHNIRMLSAIAWVA